MTTAFEQALRQVRAGTTTAEDAAEALFDRLTVPERLGLLDGDVDIEQGLTELFEAYNTEAIVAGAVPRLGIPGVRFTDGPRGVVMRHSTCFPVALARGASWDVELELEIGRAIGVEARAQGANLFAGVCINLLRHPAWGRAQETYGEDPVLLGELGGALTRGVREQVMVCVKHYALNSIENSRFSVDVTVEEDVLHEVFLPHFRSVIDAGADAVMSAYNQVNGEWAGHHRHLLTEILRDEWGFTGFVMCDFIRGIRDGCASLQAGTDLEMPFRNLRARQLPAELRGGRLDDATVRTAGTRILSAQLRHQAALTVEAPDEDVVASVAHRALARRAAALGMVLLRNQPVGGSALLPLDGLGTGAVAVLGSLADAPNLGDLGSSAVRPPSTVSPLAGIRAAFPELVSDDHGEDPERAAALAAGCAVAVVVVGMGAEDEGEGHDRSSLTLHRRDEDLIRSVSAANPRTIVVVIGGPVLLGSWRESVPALLLAWYPGMEGGHALADVLTGACEPGGRLPAAIASDPAHLPAFENDAERVAYDRWWGQRKLDHDGNLAAYPFGFGLGYTSFELRELTVDSPAGVDWSGDLAGSITARVTATNTGERHGATVVQLYGADRGSSPTAPARRQLLGFARVELPAGGQAIVELPGSLRPLARRDPVARRWIAPDCGYRLEAGQYWGDPAALTIELPLR